MNLVDPDGEAAKAFITTYKYSKKIYKIYRKQGKITASSLKKAGLSEFVDIAGDLHTIFSGNTTFWDKAGAVADLAFGSEFNNKGGVEIAKTLGILKTHKHHLIPKSVYKNFPKLKGIIDRDGAKNLIDIPEVFHGNHPQFSTWIENRINDIKGEITEEDIVRIMNEAQEHIYKAYDKFMRDGDNLNDYFREINKLANKNK